MTFTTLTLQDICPPSKIRDLDFDLHIFLPYIILPVLFIIGTISFIVTLIIMVIIGMGVLYVYTRPRQKNRSQFFLSWTIVSCVTMFLVFEYNILAQKKITEWEHYVFLLLSSCTIYFFYKLKAVANFVLAKGSSKGKEYSPVLTSDSHYCQICQIEVNERFFHTIWWDCCVFRANYHFFLVGLTFAFATLLHGTYLGFSSVCEPFELYEEIFSLIYSCEYAYDTFPFSLSLVTCVYATGYLFAVALVAVRQLCVHIPKYLVKYRGKQQYHPVSQQDI